MKASLRQRRWLKALLIVLAVVCIIALGAIIIVRRTYQQQLTAVSSSEQTVLFTVPTGASIKDISQKLKEANLIRETWAFEWYVRTQQLGDSLQAGTYALSPSQPVSEIVAILTKGEVAVNLVTILPSQRLDQIRSALINGGFTPESVDQAMKPEQYAAHPALSDKPAAASLEGYLYPESFQKTATTTPQQIIRASLDELQQRLTPDIRTAITKSGLSLHEGITLASIIAREVDKTEDKALVAQVFYKRLAEGIKLESDVTAFYGAIMADQPQSVNYDSAYNTYKRDGLPPGPISNITNADLLAVARPATTDYLFFVAGDDGKTYFSKTLSEHQMLVNQHCKRLCGR